MRDGVMPASTPIDGRPASCTLCTSLWRALLRARISDLFKNARLPFFLKIHLASFCALKYLIFVKHSISHIFYVIRLIRESKRARKSAGKKGSIWSIMRFSAILWIRVQEIHSTFCDKAIERKFKEESNVELDQSILSWRDVFLMVNSSV